LDYSRLATRLGRWMIVIGVLLLAGAALVWVLLQQESTR
jgi:hypothetical protein